MEAIVNGIIGFAVIIGAIVFIFWIFQKELKGTAFLGIFSRGLKIFGDVLLGSGRKVKDMNILTKIVNALKQAGKGLKGVR